MKLEICRVTFCGNRDGARVFGLPREVELLAHEVEVAVTAFLQIEDDVHAESTHEVHGIGIQLLAIGGHRLDLPLADEVLVVIRSVTATANQREAKRHRTRDHGKNDAFFHVNILLR